MMTLTACQNVSSSISFCNLYNPIYWDDASYSHASHEFKMNVMYNNLLWEELCKK